MTSNGELGATKMHPNGAIPCCQLIIGGVLVFAGGVGFGLAFEESYGETAATLEADAAEGDLDAGWTRLEMMAKSGLIRATGYGIAAAGAGLIGEGIATLRHEEAECQ
jgi:hypothetical protein